MHGKFSSWFSKFKPTFFRRVKMRALFTNMDLVISILQLPVTINKIINTRTHLSMKYQYFICPPHLRKSVPNTILVKSVRMRTLGKKCRCFSNILRILYQKVMKTPDNDRQKSWETFSATSSQSFLVLSC